MSMTSVVWRWRWRGGVVGDGADELDGSQRRAELSEYPESVNKQSVQVTCSDFAILRAELSEGNSSMQLEP